MSSDEVVIGGVRMSRRAAEAIENVARTDGFSAGHCVGVDLAEVRSNGAGELHRHFFNAATNPDARLAWREYVNALSWHVEREQTANRRVRVPLHILVFARDKEQWKRAAKDEGLSLTQWVERRCNGGVK